MTVRSRRLAAAPAPRTRLSAFAATGRRVVVGLILLALDLGAWAALYIGVRRLFT